MTTKEAQSSSMTAPTSLDTANTPVDLAEWVAGELASPQPDINAIVRALAHETDRWLKVDFSSNSSARFFDEPASTGNTHWDALLEGLTAFRCDQLGVHRPAWTARTNLAVGWNPYDDSDNPPDVQWAMLDTLETPVVMLEKGVTFSLRILELL